MEVKQSERFEDKVIITRDRATGHSVISFNQEKIPEVIDGLKKLQQ